MSKQNTKICEKEKKKNICLCLHQISFSEYFAIQVLKNYSETHSSWKVMDSQPKETKVNNLRLSAVWGGTCNQGGTLGKPVTEEGWSLAKGLCQLDKFPWGTDSDRGMQMEVGTGVQLKSSAEPGLDGLRRASTWLRDHKKLIFSGPLGSLSVNGKTRLDELYGPL